MSLDQTLEARRESIVFVRGTSVEEVLWLTKIGRDGFKFQPSHIHLWAIVEGSKRVGVDFQNQIPPTCTFENMRDQALLWTGDYYDLIRHYQYTLGIEDATEEPTISRKSYRDYKQLFRDRRAGVILYLNKHILANGFEIDPFLKEDDTLFAVSIPINPNFDYSSAVVCVEPVCPYDHYILSRSLTPDMAVTRSRFGSYREMCKYVRTKQFL